MIRSIIVLALFSSACCLAQLFPAHPGNAATATVLGPPNPEPVTTGLPYTADQWQEYTPPGESTPTRGSVIGHFARDSQGRTRKSVALLTSGWRTEIYDPVAGVAIYLDDQAKVAHRMPAKPATTPPPQPPLRPGTSNEPLGSRMIDGTMAEGSIYRSPMLSVETWKSNDLNLDVETHSSNGYTSRLINLSRAEPDPALFRPPEGYTVIDESAPFVLAKPAGR